MIGWIIAGLILLVIAFLIGIPWDSGSYSGKQIFVHLLLIAATAWACFYSVNTCAIVVVVIILGVLIAGWTLFSIAVFGGNVEQWHTIWIMVLFGCLLALLQLVAPFPCLVNL